MMLQKLLNQDLLIENGFINKKLILMGKKHYKEENNFLATTLYSYDNLIMDLHKNAIAEWEEKLKVYLKENLKQFGYDFENDNEFLDFCKIRVNRLCFEDKPNYYEFYLDYVNEENTGKLIGCCSDNIDFINNGDKTTIKIGKSYN